MNRNLLIIRHGITKWNTPNSVADNVYELDIDATKKQMAWAKKVVESLDEFHPDIRVFSNGIERCIFSCEELFDNYEVTDEPEHLFEALMQEDILLFIISSFIRNLLRYCIFDTERCYLTDEMKMTLIALSFTIEGYDKPRVEGSVWKIGMTIENGIVHIMESTLFLPKSVNRDLSGMQGIARFSYISNMLHQNEGR